MHRKIILSIFLFTTVFLLAGCITNHVKVFSDGTDPLKEFTLSGKGRDRVAVVPIDGIISLESVGNFLHSRPGKVQEVVSQLHVIENDPRVKAVVLMVNSPGGTITASDMLYEEIRRFKERSGVKIVVCMLDLAASGGYYISLPADLIYAHPTTLTGSVGVIFMRPELDGLLNKIGVNVNTGKSGEFKDMGNPFRGATNEENKLFHEIIMNMASKFTEKVAKHRKLSPEKMKEVATAKIYTADNALEAGLIDKIGYLGDALTDSMKLANIPLTSRIVVYRRDRYSNDNPYIMDSRTDSAKPLVDTGVIGQATKLSTGFYYIWPAVIP